MRSYAYQPSKQKVRSWPVSMGCFSTWLAHIDFTPTQSSKYDWVRLVFQYCCHYRKSWISKCCPILTSGTPFQEHFTQQPIKLTVHGNWHAFLAVSLCHLYTSPLPCGQNSKNWSLSTASNSIIQHTEHTVLPSMYLKHRSYWGVQPIVQQITEKKNHNCQHQSFLAQVTSLWAEHPRHNPTSWWHMPHPQMLRKHFPSPPCAPEAQVLCWNPPKKIAQRHPPSSGTQEVSILTEAQKWFTVLEWQLQGTQPETSL